MLFSDSYFTIKKAAQGVYKDRGSKFLAFAFPVHSEKEIKEHLLALRKEHPGANHHCYAWRLGADGLATRANDDGEPSNSAGKPVLGQLLAKSVTNCLIVVLRYFGGSLLGVSGLINAYKTAAAEALSNSGIEERFILFEYKIEFSFEDINPVMKIIKDTDSKILSQNYTETNEVIFRIKKENSNQLEESIKNLYKTKLHYIKTI
ncbi:MAG: YigZ family protein [Bacteroidetes bacterium]|nr:YigZ family protein [Bacteroidota bacterium]